MSSKGPARPRLPIGLRPLESTGNATDIVALGHRFDVLSNNVRELIDMIVGYASSIARMSDDIAHVRSEQKTLFEGQYRIEGRVDAQGGDLTATRVQLDRRIATVELELATVSGRMTDLTRHIELIDTRVTGIERKGKGKGK